MGFSLYEDTKVLKLLGLLLSPFLVFVVVGVLFCLVSWILDLLMSFLGFLVRKFHSCKVPDIPKFQSS